MTEFEQHRPRLRALAYRMLGSAAEADDAVQEAWLRYDRADLTPQAVSAETAQACLDVLNRLQAAGCDALGLGRKAIWSAWSMSDWRDSDFPARLQNLRWTVEVRSEPAA